MVNKGIGWTVSWSLYSAAGWVAYARNSNEFLSRALFPLYSALMDWSVRIQDWSGCKGGPWPTRYDDER